MWVKILSYFAIFYSDDGRQSGIGDNYKPTSAHPNYTGSGGNQYLQNMRSQVRYVHYCAVMTAGIIRFLMALLMIIYNLCFCGELKTVSL